MIAPRCLKYGLLLTGLLGFSLQGAVAAEGPTTLLITATDPGDIDTLPTGTAYSIRVRFRSPTAFRLRVQGLQQGATVAGTTHASPRYGPGAGEAIAWLSYHQPTQLDRILLVAEDAATGQVLAKTARPVQLIWSSAANAPHIDPASWVVNLNNAAQRAVAAEVNRPRQPAPPDWPVRLMQAIALSIPVYLVLQLSLPWFFRGRWRKAAWAPAWVTVPLFAVVLVATYGFDVNLAPIWLLIICPPLSLYLALLPLIFWMKRPRT